MHPYQQNQKIYVKKMYNDFKFRESFILALKIPQNFIPF